MEDNRAIAERNEAQVLAHLHRFGWLTARMVAALVWPCGSQQLAMAARTLRRLADTKQVLRRELAGGAGPCYVLAASGARRLRDERDIHAESGVSLQLGNARHRAASNWYLAVQMRNGLTVWTEHEIVTGRAGPLPSYFGKLPDGLVQADQGMVWVEVENAWKNREERRRIVRLVEDNLGLVDDAGAPVEDRLFRVVVVATNETALRMMALAFAEAHRAGTVRDAQLTEVEAVLLTVSDNLVPGTIRCQDMWYDIVRVMLRPVRDGIASENER